MCVVFKLVRLGIYVAVAVFITAGPAHSRSNSLPSSQNHDSGGTLSTSALQDMTALGQGSLSWFGLPIYDAALWSGRGDFERWGFGQRLALRIDYHRNIKAARLAERTRKEWNRLEGQLDLPAATVRDHWLSEVEAIWPDVAPGDFLVTIVEPGGPSAFFGPQGLLGVIDDPDFGPTFLSIWLHPETSRPDLRAALIGEPGAEG